MNHTDRIAEIDGELARIERETVADCIAAVVLGVALAALLFWELSK